MTRARPSTDALTQPNMPRPSISGRTSRTPSETGSRMSPPKMQREGSVNSLHGRSFDREGSSFSRTYSRAGDTVEESVRPRSRSQSIDPASAPVRPGITERSSLDVPKKGIMRAPSGKDLFKGREVGFMRRSTSSAISLKKVKASIGRTDSQSQQRLGLLGRKTSDPVKARRNSQGMSLSSVRADPRFRGANSIARIAGHVGLCHTVQTPLRHLWLESRQLRRSYAYERRTGKWFTKRSWLYATGLHHRDPSGSGQDRAGRSVCLGLGSR